MPGVRQLVALLSGPRVHGLAVGQRCRRALAEPARQQHGGSYSVAVSAVAHLLAPFACPPITCKVQAGGRVVANPKIVNLFWDDNWDAHNPGSLTKAQTNATVQLLTSSEYLDGANQYGVHRGNFVGAHASSTLCQTMRPTAHNGSAASHTNPGTMNLSSLLGWVTCEIQGSIGTGVPLPDNNTIYSVFLPEGVTITGSPGADCHSVDAFHMTAAVLLPNGDADLLLGIVLKLVAFPVIVMPAECMLGSTPAATKDDFSEVFAHELVEAALDPVAPTGWIDNKWAPDIANWTSKGEPGDICEGNAYSGVPGIAISPVRLRSNGLSVLRYWSNKDKQCIPIGVAAHSTTTTTPADTTPTKTTTTKTTTDHHPGRRRGLRSRALRSRAPGRTRNRRQGRSPSLNGAVYALNATTPGFSSRAAASRAPAATRRRPICELERVELDARRSPTLNGDVHAIAYQRRQGLRRRRLHERGRRPEPRFRRAWNGVKWGPVCNSPGPLVTANVNALQIIGSTLYIGGSFANGAGIASADFLLACNLSTGVASSTVLKDGDFAGAIYALAADSQGTLYAGGGFSNLAGIPAADDIAAYSGGAWHALGSGPSPGGGPIDDFVRSLTRRDELYVGTDSKNVGGIAQADHVARWNGSAWSAVGANKNGTDGWFPATGFIYALPTPARVSSPRARSRTRAATRTPTRSPTSTGSPGTPSARTAATARGSATAWRSPPPTRSSTRAGTSRAPAATRRLAASPPPHSPRMLP